MSDRPAVTSRPLTRQKLAAVLGEKPEQIRAFEAMLEDVSRVLPDATAASNARTTGLELVVGAYSGITLQQAIDKAFAAGGGIVKPLPVVHTLTQQLFMKPGVILDLSAGATLQRGFNTGANLIGVAGTGANIAIIGGTLDNQGQTFDAPANIFGAAGIQNLRIVGVTFLSVVDFHAVDINDCEDVHITDCGFYGFHNKSGSRQFSEAIQLDNLGGTQNRNVQVRGCKFGAALDASLTDFGAWPCALGNHAGIDGIYQDDIAFTDCSVTGAGWAGLNLLNMRDVTVTGNRFTDCLHGVRLRLYDRVSPAQGCTGVTITGNAFSNTTGNGVEFSGVTPAFLGDVLTGRHRDITITGNTCVGSGSTLAELLFAENVAITGNTVKGGDYGVSVRFSSGVSITGNQVADVEFTGVYVNENIETSLAGLGLTEDITITGNTLRSCGYRGVHINGAARRVHVGGNHVIDPSTASPTREGIRADSAPQGVSIIGNTVRFSGTVHSPYGISVSGSPTDVTIRGNSSIGSAAAYQVQTVDALLDIEGDGSPEGVFSAAIGSRYLRTDGSTGTVLYIKESGTGDTGWVDGAGAPKLPSYTVGALPSAAAFVQRLIYVSDGTGNKRLGISDGTNWRFPDGAVVT